MVKLPFISFISLCLLLFIHSTSSQNPNDPIKLHIFLFSHMDEGWIYTFENYYTGANGASSADGGCVRCIFNNVYGSLLKNPDRKYQLAEVAFLNRWWSEQDEAHRNQFKKFVADKQIQFVNAGWAANDEACAYYEDIIDQFTLGFRWVKREFNVDPDVGWQIDSFGHSSTHAAIMAQAGFRGLFFGRIDYQDWENRRNQKTLEFNWKTQNPHNESVVGHLLYTHYSDTKFFVPDNFFCRSIFCRGRLGVNGYQKVTEWVQKQSNSFRTKNIALLVGDDFHLWQDAEKDFDGIEDLIRYYNEDNKQLNIRAKFSTLNEYVDEFDRDYTQDTYYGDLPEKHGDFFPYVENEWTSWVGYFTSKSMFKLKIREMSQYYNAAKLLLAKFMLENNPETFNLGMKFDEIDKALFALEDPLAVVQHHDAVTGTNREEVRADYERMLNTGKQAVEGQIQPILRAYSKKITGETPSYAAVDFDWRNKDGNLFTLFDQEKKVLVNVFNPGEKDKFLIKIKVPTYKYSVTDDQNNFIVVDIICNSNDAKDDCFIYFVDEIPAYSLKNYIIRPARLSKRVIPEVISQDTTLEVGSQVKLTVSQDLKNFDYTLCPPFNPENIHDLINPKKCIEDSFNLDYEYYESHLGSGLHVSSGAYIFQPRSEVKKEYSPVSSGRVFKGRYLTMVQVFRSDLRTDLKLVHHDLAKGIEIESYLGPVTNYYNGKEIVIMLRSHNIRNNDLVFYTDANGYYMEKRQTNHRDTYVSKNNVPLPSNYYPMNSGFYIESDDKKERLTIMTDRSQGVTCMKPGEMEILIHRYTLRDDWKGMPESLQEFDPDGTGLLKVSTRHYLMYSAPEIGFTHQQRQKQYRLDRDLQFWFANVQTYEFVPQESEKDIITLDLPDNIKLYIRSYNVNEYTVRLHNLDEEKTKFVQVYNQESSICDLLNQFAGISKLKVKSIKELSIFTTKEQSQVPKNNMDRKAKKISHSNDGPELSKVELVPMEIRTFSIIVE